jgi:hypothetical protein
LIKDIKYEAGKLIAFDHNGGIIEINNNCEIAIDIIVFGAIYEPL